MDLDAVDPVDLEGILHVRNVDILDGTPLLDIKPYVPEFDQPERVRTGWPEQVRQDVAKRRSDDRFKSFRGAGSP